MKKILFGLMIISAALAAKRTIEQLDKKQGNLSAEQQERTDRQ